jgi:hypothetical protein
VTTADKDAILKMVGDGKTPSQIAAKLGKGLTEEDIRKSRYYKDGLVIVHYTAKKKPQ